MIGGISEFCWDNCQRGMGQKAESFGANVRTGGGGSRDEIVFVFYVIFYDRFNV